MRKSPLSALCRCFVAAAFLAGCDGLIDSPLNPTVDLKPKDPTVVVEPGAALPPSRVRTDRAFAPSTDRVALLPFQVRMNKLSAITGLPTSDAMFAELTKRKLDLGAHDFGANVAPDLTWSAQRMSTWVQALFPVCDDARLKTRYPDWRTSLDQFSRAAWGRPSTAEDLALLDAVIAEEPTANRWRASCLMLLSSIELVAQ